MQNNEFKEDLIMNRIYLYGIAGANDKYAVIRYQAVDVEHRPIDAIKMEAEIMRM